MAYALPSPSVHQILVRSSQALTNAGLLPCVMGTLKQVVKDESIDIVFPATNVTIAFPRLKPAAIIDTLSVKLKIKNATIEIAANISATGAFVAGKDSVTSTGAFAIAHPGDKVILSGNAGTYTIREVVDANTVKLTRLINYTATTETFSILRVIPEVEPNIIGAVFEDTFFTFASLEYNGKNILGGKAFISYMADRRDLTGFYMVDDLSQLKEEIGTDIENPLGYILGVLMPSAGGAAKTMAYIMADSDEAAYMLALEDLETRRDIYIVHALSTNQNIQKAIAAHTQSLSDPRFSMFRLGAVTTGLEKDLAVATAKFVQA